MKNKDLKLGITLQRVLIGKECSENMQKLCSKAVFSGFHKEDLTLKHGLVNGLSL